MILLAVPVGDDLPRSRVSETDISRITSVPYVGQTCLRAWDPESPWSTPSRTGKRLSRNRLKEPQITLRHLAVPLLTRRTDLSVVKK